MPVRTKGKGTVRLCRAQEPGWTIPDLTNSEDKIWQTNPAGSSEYKKYWQNGEWPMCRKQTANSDPLTMTKTIGKIIRNRGERGSTRTNNLQHYGCAARCAAVAPPRRRLDLRFRAMPAH